MASQRLDELVLRAWEWLPVRGRVGATLLGAFLLYWIWRAAGTYLRAPVVLYRRDVIATVDRTRTIEPAHREPVDGAVLAFVRGCEEALAPLGFSSPHRTTTCTRFPITAVASLMEQPEAGDLASIVAIAGGSGLATSLTFESRLAGGARLVTTNSRAAQYWPAPPRVESVRLPDVQDADELYRLHQVRVIARRARSRQVKLTRGATAEQRLVFVKRETLDWHNHLVRCGYRRRTALGLRPTARGAMFTAWRHVWPWRHANDWIARRRARSVLRLA